MVTVTESQRSEVIELSITIPVSIGLQLAVKIVSLYAGTRDVMVVVMESHIPVVMELSMTVPVSIGLQLTAKIVSL